MKTAIQKKEQNATLNASKKQTRPPMNTVGLESDDRASIREILSEQTLQPKLKISQPNDKYEQEADRVADEVMRMPEPKLQSQSEPEEEEETLQTKPVADQITPLVQRQEESNEEEGEILQSKSKSNETVAATPSLESQINSLKGGGQPLDPPVRSFFEPRFGADFGQVRVHADDRGDRATQSVNARAFALGNDIAFQKEEYRPGSREGRELLAHELTHVIQQGGLASSHQLPATTGAPWPFQQTALNGNTSVKKHKLNQTIQHFTSSSAIIQRTTSKNGFIEWIDPSGRKSSTWLHIGSRADWLTILPGAGAFGIRDYVLMFLIAAKAQIADEKSSLVIKGNTFNLRLKDDSRPNEHDIMEFMRALYSTSGNLELEENLLALAIATDYRGDITREILGELIAKYQPRILSERAGPLAPKPGISNLGESAEKLAEAGGSNVRDTMVTSAFSSFIATESVMKAIASEADYTDFKTRACALAERSGVIIRSAKRASDAAIESRKGVIDCIVDTAIDLIPMPDISSTLVKKAVDTVLGFISGPIKEELSSIISFDSLDKQINEMTNFAEEWPGQLVMNELLERELNKAQRYKVISDMLIISKFFRDKADQE